MKCDYGCGKEAKYILKNGKNCCSIVNQQCTEVKRKIAIGVSTAHKNGRCGTTQLKSAREWWKYKSKEEINEIRKKQGKTYSENQKSGKTKNYWKGKKLTNEHKQKISNSANEKNNGFVKTQYYEIYCPYMKQVVKVQGTWEYKFALFLNYYNIRWERSRKNNFKYKYKEDDYLHTYYPDFYLPDSDEYIEIKGHEWKSIDGRVDDALKMKKVKEYNKNEKIIIFKKQELDDLGIFNIDFNKIKNDFIKIDIKKKNKIIKEKTVNNFSLSQRKRFNTEKTILERKESLKNIDLNKFGWVAKVSILWGVSHTSVKRWIKKYYPDLLFYQRRGDEIGET